MRKLPANDYYRPKKVRDLLWEQIQVTTHTANGAIPVTEDGHHRLNGSSLAMTLAAPTKAGVLLKVTNVAGSAATLTVTSPDADATANVFTLAAAAATARAALWLEAINLGTEAVPSLVWSTMLGAGTTVA